MPRLSGPARINLLADSQIVRHWAASDDILLRPQSEMTENGLPTFTFQKRCHDEFHALSRRYSFLAIDLPATTRYEDFAYATLQVRALFRREYLRYLNILDIEDPRMGEFLVLIKNNPSINYDTAAAMVNA